MHLTSQGLAYAQWLRLVRKQFRNEGRQTRADSSRTRPNLAEFGRSRAKNGRRPQKLGQSRPNAVDCCAAEMWSVRAAPLEVPVSLQPALGWLAPASTASRAQRRAGSAKAPQACPFGCFAVGGDDVRHICFCTVLDPLFAGRRDGVRPGRLAGGALTTLLMLVPTDEHMTIVHGAWLYIICLVYSGASGFAQQSDAQSRIQAEFRALLSRRPPLRRMLLAR